MNVLKKSLFFIFFIIVSVGFVSCERTNENIKEISTFPPYVDKEKVSDAFGKIFMILEFSSTSSSEYQKVITTITIFCEKKGENQPLAVISKNGFLKNGDEDISPKGLNPASDFMSNYFIGFSIETINNPFVLYGIAKSLEGDIYETDPLVIWYFDYDNQTTKLYIPSL